MSWKATAYVKEITEGITPSEKLLLFVLADYHNTAKSLAWPSVPVLAMEALMSERQATRILADLEKKNFIQRIRPTGGHATTMYQFVALDQGRQNVIPENIDRGDIGMPNNVTPEPRRDDTRDDKSAHAIRKEPVIEPVLETNGGAPPEIPNDLHGTQYAAKIIDEVRSRQFELSASFAITQAIAHAHAALVGTGKSPAAAYEFLLAVTLDGMNAAR
jgi:hypothetical protein